MGHSGRTTTYEHKGNKDWKDSIGAGTDCIQQKVLFDVQWSNCPVEVEDEVRQLWKDCKYGNDNYYHKWDKNYALEYSHEYPMIAEYLKSRGVDECLIHWWW